MLSRLYIKNYAILREVDIFFASGLNIITGETGAGKSILMGALNLVLGERADKEVLLDATQKCIVEATYQPQASDTLKRIFEQEDLEWQDEIIVRRELQANGKSRSFINDTPVTLAQLKKLGNELVDLHQQFDTSELTAEDFQTNVLDALADCLEEAATMQAQFKKLSIFRTQLLEKEKLRNEASAQQDYHQFLYDELESLALKDHELEDLAAELTTLTNADHIQATLSQVADMMEGSEQPVVQKIKTIQQKLEAIQSFHPSIAALMPRLQSALIEIKDMAAEIAMQMDRMQSNPARMLEIEERINAGYKLQKKHQVQTTAELLSIQANLSLRLQQFEDTAQALDALKTQVSQQEKHCMELASALSKKRNRVAPMLADSVNALLKQLGMPNAAVEVRVEKSGLRAHGIDKIQLLFDANRSGKFDTLAKVASGGELSRLMLAIKSLVAGKLAMPTLIFDEIDTGISGEAAKQVGLLMKALARDHQMMAITHQPQIAAKADTHYFIYKQEMDGQVQTAVRKLTDTERVEVIAQMMSGEKPTAAALENAREMVTGKG